MTVKLEFSAVGVLCTYSDYVTINDVMSAGTAISSSKDAASLTHCIHDFTLATQIEGGAVGVASIAGHFGQRVPVSSMCVAIVLSEPAAQASNARLHASAASRPTKVFNSTLQALKWISESGK